jgi:hypothetical protein
MAIDVDRRCTAAWQGLCSCLGWRVFMGSRVPNFGVGSKFAFGVRLTKVSFASEAVV